MSVNHTKTFGYLFLLAIINSQMSVLMAARKWPGSWAPLYTLSVSSATNVRVMKGGCLTWLKLISLIIYPDSTSVSEENPFKDPQSYWMYRLQPHVHWCSATLPFIFKILKPLIHSLCNFFHINRLFLRCCYVSADDGISTDDGFL